MPNLKHFYFHLDGKTITEKYSPELLDGYMWNQMLNDYLPNLSRFEFYMIIKKAFPLLNLDDIVASFIPIARQYPGWQMIVDQWVGYKQNDSE